MMEKIKKDAETRMTKTVETLQHELSKVRTGRANVGFLDHVLVDYYGNPTPLNQIANISVADSRTLTVTPWESTMVAAAEKAILNSDLGLNPSKNGNIIRVPLPPLTEERRKELVRIVKAEGEQGKISIRNIRRDANNHLKDLVKAKEISEDDENRATAIIQKITDQHIADIDALLAVKEKDLLL